MKNEAVIEKVRKLRALATSQNAHEAAAAAAAADRLIQEHRLSEAELHAEAPESAVEGEYLYSVARVDRWRSSLAATLLRHYGCYGVHDHTPVAGRVVLRIFGTPSDLEIVKYMYAWLTTEAERLVNRAGVKGRTGRNSWFFGFVAGIAAQLDAAKAATEVAATIAGRRAGLVHLATALARSEALGRSQFQRLTKGGGSRARLERDAFSAGKRTGENMHLGKGLATRPGRALGMGTC